MKLPEEIVSLCHQHGIYAKVVYVPGVRSSRKEKRRRILRALLEEMENLYEDHLETFQTVPRCFNVRDIRARYSISSNLASIVTRAALRTWHRWFNKHEKQIFFNLSPSLKPEYMRIRKQLRHGVEPSGSKDLIEKARQSLENCPWHRLPKVLKKPQITITLDASSKWDIEIYNWLRNAPRISWPLLVRKAIVEYLRSYKDGLPPVSLTERPTTHQQNSWP